MSTEKWQATQEIVASALEYRSKFDLPQWKKFIAENIRSSPSEQIAHKCPITSRNFFKPRGYAGDAIVLDLLYGIELDKYGVDKLGYDACEVYRHNCAQPAARAVRFRRKLLAEYIDAACEQRIGMASVLSVACGHLRETVWSESLRKRNFETFVALDQDEGSLKVVARDYGDLGITTVKNSVLDLLKARSGIEGQTFDLVYAAGLYDYLDNDVAKSLTALLFGRLQQDGKLLIANFLPGIPDVGYLEAYMDWWLIYRSAEELLACAPENSNARTFTDPDMNIVFMEMTKTPG